MVSLPLRAAFRPACGQRGAPGRPAQGRCGDYNTAFDSEV